MRLCYNNIVAGVWPAKIRLARREGQEGYTMKEFEKIQAIISTARRCLVNTPKEQNAHALCRSVELLGTSLLDTAKHFRELHGFDCVGEYLEGALIGKVAGFNQLSILLSLFFPAVSTTTIDIGDLKEELMTEEGEKECQS